MVLISTQIEIAGSPERVREVFLDFDKFPEWANGNGIKTVKRTSEGGQIEKGEKLHVSLPGTSFSPIVLENTETKFTWRGSLWPIFAGDHSFCFEPSETTPGSTTFRQFEEFSGVLSILMYLQSFGGKTQQAFESFNEDLKKRVEGKS